MKLSTRARYGARALVELASVYPDRALTVKEVARRQRLSPKYLEQIMSVLKAAGLVRAVRGLHGGYRLASPPRSVTLREVFQVLEGSPAPVECVDHPGSCLMEPVCPTRETWAEIKSAISGILDRTTLQDLLERKRRKTESLPQMYYI